MKKLKIGDYIIIAVVVGLIFLLFVRTYSINASGDYLEVTGLNFKSAYDPSEDRVIEVEGPLGITKVVIQNGEAWVEDSPCKDKICIKMGKIKRAGEEAVCIPNRVVVQMKGAKSYVDGVAR
jgi:hypothetical protein